MLPSATQRSGEAGAHRAAIVDVEISPGRKVVSLPQSEVDFDFGG
jgi:methyl coenzyme M reductase subunit C